MDPSYSTHTLSRKLKDSCGLCSASKVRCEMGNPACARCTSLNEPCLYSPARRAGRTRRIRRESYQEPGQQQQQYLEYLASSTAHGTQASDIGELDWGSKISFDDTITSGTHVPPYAYGRKQPEPDPSAPLAGESDTIPGGDCARAAALILEGLDPAKTGSHRSQPGCKITEACQQILTILVCPCSEHPAVVLFVPSGCLALMDTACRLARGHGIGASKEPLWTNPIIDNDKDQHQHQHHPYLDMDSFTG
ncbi:hypothetical protein PG994_008211 [Apiospora phragmitis]|uniref:Zn(2)-C6 fungal-type domain-containing protein n=1 Tax=Apiospora phragmitis TaxID=2905665 RepID=A0ABR1USF1_9PEZI